MHMDHVGSVSSVCQNGPGRVAILVVTQKCHVGVLGSRSRVACADPVYLSRDDDRDLSVDGIPSLILLTSFPSFVSLSFTHPYMSFIAAALDGQIAKLAALADNPVIPYKDAVVYLTAIQTWFELYLM